MSNIYIQEPPTLGKVLLETTVGDIDIELWGREAPKACRNFVQLCMEGYYDETIFHRVVKGFICQGGDPDGTGLGGESIYGKPFKDEFHTRLRFVRRGLVAMANGGEKDDNESQFFFTMAPCPELQNKHTIFGKVTGNTLYNMLKLEDCLVDNNERPLYPHKIIRTQVLNNPFSDIVPRVKKKVAIKHDEEKKSTSAATKNFKLLSFGEEAEEDEEETDAVAKEFRGKSKSSHDLTDDPKLSSVSAVDDLENKSAKRKREKSKSKIEEDENADKYIDTEETLEKIQKKLTKVKEEPKITIKENLDENEIEFREEQKKLDDIRKEVKKLKKELAGSQKKDSQKNNESETTAVYESLVVKEYKQEKQKYEEKKKAIDKSISREKQTLALLAKFQSKLQEAKEQPPPPPKKSDEADKEDDENDDEGWMTHTLQCEHSANVKDANMNDEDTYEIFDPRNPINIRRREASKNETQDRSSNSHSKKNKL